MAFIKMDMMSQSLLRKVPVNIIIPIERITVPGFPAPPPVDKPFKTLYLLHGAFSGYMDWALGMSIQQYAEAHNIAVIMPEGENSFYLDHPERFSYYSTFIGEELVEMTRKLFPLSDKREDTFIGGLSMGGYGAMHNGLKYHSTFSTIISLSGGFTIEDAVNSKPDAEILIFRRDFAEFGFGNLDTLLESDRNPKCQIKQLIEEGSDIPDIYMACGEQDFLLENNNDFADFLCKNNVNVTYETAPGTHDSVFWDTYIKKALDWKFSSH